MHRRIVSMRMDERAVVAAEDQLVEWGLLERGASGLAWSRRFRGAVMREAARLAGEERAGQRRPGAPLATAVAAALGTYALPAGAAASAVHEKLLYAVELAALPEGVREIVGGA